MPNLLEDFLKHAQQNGEKPAILWSGEENTVLSYDTLALKMQSYSDYVKGLRMRKNAKAVWLVPLEYSNIHIFLACLYSGITMVSVPRGISKWKLVQFLFHEKITYLIYQTNTLIYKWIVKCCGFQLLNDVPLKKHTLGASMTLSGDTMALITRTSGSTDVSKPIKRTHGTLIKQHLAILKLFTPQKDEVDLPLFPNLLLHNLNAGITTVIPDIKDWKLENLEPHKIMEQIYRHQVTRLTGNVYYFTKLTDYIAHSSPNDLLGSTVRSIGVGGSPVPNKLLEKIKSIFTGAKVYVIYGSTEAEPIAVKEYVQSYDPLLGYCVGTIHPDLDVIIDHIEITTTVGSIKIGELVVSGSHVVNEKPYRTGDYGYVKDDELYLVARKGNSSSFNGYYHYQIEHFLLHYCNITQVAVIMESTKIRIHFSGNDSKENIKDKLSEIIDVGSFQVKKHDFLPVDARHLSKIRYSHL